MPPGYPRYLLLLDTPWVLGDTQLQAVPSRFLLISVLASTCPEEAAVPSSSLGLLSLAGIRMEPLINPTIQEICETLSIKGCLTTGLREHRAVLGLRVAGRCCREGLSLAGLPTVLRASGGLPCPLDLPPIYHQGQEVRL